ncbi:MAG: universal stress protein [Deltaproteobacteria bacterium]|nr:MAG: universal stress protein [Deltaproteobacteria bacterium]
MDEITKLIVLPVDGSENALRSLDYLNLTYGSKHNLEMTLLYVLPSLPPILDDTKAMERETATKIRKLQNKSIRMAERILAAAKDSVLQKGFDEERIRTVYKKKEVDIARDICTLAENKQADAVLITTRGRSRLEAFFMGEVSSKLLDYCRVCPVWIVEGLVTSKRVLIAVDSSENALRAVDHAGFMLAGTDCEVTLFHTMRHLRRFVPLEVLEEAPELEALWKSKAGEEIAPYMKKAKEMLVAAGLDENQITTKVVDGSRSAANDILEEARSNGYGTIVLGRRGLSGVQEFFMGSVTSKVLQNCAGMAAWIVL